MATSIELAARLAAVVATQQEVFSAVEDREKVMTLVTDRVPEVTSGDGAVIELVEGDEMVYRAASGTARKHLGLRLRRAGSLSGRAVDENAVLRSDDVDSDPRVDAAACRAIGIRSMIIAPLREGSRPIGALKAFSAKPQNFDDLDGYALQLLAGMTSSALTLSRTFLEREASEARYRLLFESNVAGVFRSTLDGRILDCNESLVRTLGYDSREELLARPAWDLYHQRGDREEILELLRKNRSMLNIRVPLVRKDGTNLLGLVSASLVPGEGGETTLLGTIVEA